MIRQVERLFPSQNGLNSAIREEVAELLNQQLADALDLYTHCKQAHWNVKGIQFYSLHLLFDQLAEHLLEHQDLLAERVTALGGAAMGTLHLAAEYSRLEEYPDVVMGVEHLQALINSFGFYARSLRSAIDQALELGDTDSSDLLTELSRQADKDLWFLEAHLQG